MISIIKRTDESTRVLKLFQGLLGSIPQGAATLESKRTKNDDGTIIWLTPANKHAAEFGAHTEDGGLFLVDVFFGSGTTFELENGDFDGLLELVRRLGLAVISGKCEERFGFLGVRGEIQMDGEKSYRCTHYFYPRLYPKIVRYEPYCPEATNS
jgi:hypothetical protein